MIPLSSRVHRHREDKNLGRSDSKSLEPTEKNVEWVRAAWQRVGQQENQGATDGCFKQHVSHKLEHGERKNTESKLY